MGIKNDYYEIRKRYNQWVRDLPTPLKASKRLLYDVNELIDKYTFKHTSSSPFFTRIVNLKQDICTLIENG